MLLTRDVVTIIVFILHVVDTYWYIIIMQIFFMRHLLNYNNCIKGVFLEITQYLSTHNFYIPRFQIYQSV